MTNENNTMVRLIIENCLKNTDSVRSDTGKQADKIIKKLACYNFYIVSKTDFLNTMKTVRQAGEKIVSLAEETFIEDFACKSR